MRKRKTVAAVIVSLSLASVLCPVAAIADDGRESLPDQEKENSVVEEGEWYSEETGTEENTVNSDGEDGLNEEAVCEFDVGQKEMSQEFEKYEPADDQVDSATVSSQNIVRLGGSTRYSTSKLLAEYGYSSATCAIIVSGEDNNWPDSIAAAGLSGVKNAPVIITPRTYLSSEASSAISSLGVSEVYIIGDEYAVSSAVQTSLANIVGSSRVHRISGSDRVETSVAIYKSVTFSSWGNPEDVWDVAGLKNWKTGIKRAAILVKGDSSADGFSAITLSRRHRYPIFLLPSDGSLPSSVRYELIEGQFDEIFVIGGGIPDETVALVERVADTPFRVYRLSGSDRYETSVAVTKQLGWELHSDYRNDVIAISGTGTVDGRSAAGIPGVVLLAGDSNGPASNLTSNYRDLHGSRQICGDKVVVVGDVYTLPKSVEQAFLDGMG